MLVLKLLKQCLEQYELLIRLVIACVLGITIGFERKSRNKIAGVRTHAIVAFGAALIMIVSKYGFGDVPDYDASRIASQIVSGIGFLGAGIIFVKYNASVSGLTTAAGIWATSGVGMSIGAGQYFIAISSSILMLVLQELLHRVKFLSNETCHANIKLTMQNKINVQELEEFLLSKNVEIETVRMNISSNRVTKLELEMVFSSNHDKVMFLNSLASCPNVISVYG